MKIKIGTQICALDGDFGIVIGVTEEGISIVWNDKTKGVFFRTYTIAHFSNMMIRDTLGRSLWRTVNVGTE